MIRKAELIDAINGVEHDLIALALRVGSLEDKMEALEGDKLEKAIKKVGGPKKVGRPRKADKK